MNNPGKPQGQPGPAFNRAGGLPDLGPAVRGTPSASESDRERGAALNAALDRRDAKDRRELSMESLQRNLASQSRVPASLGFQEIPEPTLPASSAIDRVPPRPVQQEQKMSQNTTQQAIPQAMQPAATPDLDMQVSMEEINFILPRIIAQRNDAQTLAAVLQGRVDFMTASLNAQREELTKAREELAVARGAKPAPDSYQDAGSYGDVTKAPLQVNTDERPEDSADNVAPPVT